MEQKVNRTWTDYSERLKSALGLKGSPVAVSYSNTPAMRASTRHFRVCGAILKARNGTVINLSKESCACSGGTIYLGLEAPSDGDEEFLVYEEKLISSLAVARRAITYMNQKAPPPRGLAKYVVLSPLGKVALQPDLVLFLCNAEQASRIIALAMFEDGIVASSENGGSLCWNAITYPLISGNINVSLGDISARWAEKWEPDELIVSVPRHKLHQLVDSLNYSMAGAYPHTG